ncbi:MAG: hypothetical protein P8Y53_06890 [Pseudolabrys sp.]
MPAAAQERVRVGLTRVAANSAVSLATARGYFKAEVLDVDLRGFVLADQVAQALAGGALDFGVADFTATVFNLAGRGRIKGDRGAGARAAALRGQ